jgi:predicted ABC-type ATPase
VSTRGQPVMIVVAGPAGSGKSTVFPLALFGVDFFNVDDRCAELNGGSYAGISTDTRMRAGVECRAFVGEHIASRGSFAVETTLRTEIAIEQAAAAKAESFRSAPGAARRR